MFFIWVLIMEPKQEEHLDFIQQSIVVTLEEGAWLSKEPLLMTIPP